MSFVMIEINYLTVVATSNPELSIKTTKNVHMTHKHCTGLIIISTDAVVCLYSPLYKNALPVLYYYVRRIIPTFNTFTSWLVTIKNAYFY